MAMRDCRCGQSFFAAKNDGFRIDLYTRKGYNVGMLCVYLQGRIGLKKRVNITLEDDVIQRIDRYAQAHYTSRSGAITMLIVEATGTQKEQEKSVAVKR